MPQSQRISGKSAMREASSILSRLTIEEALRTSVLSRRWEHLWKFTRSLNFDISNTKRFQRVAARKYRFPLTKLLIGKERIVYINWVNQVLELHRGLLVEQFKVCFDMESQHSHIIDNWLEFALKRGVQRLELDFTNFLSTYREHNYNFPGVEKLAIYMQWPARSALTVLSFKFLDITGEVIEYLLSSCPFLECLCVRGSDCIKKLKIAGSSLNLKELEISYCRNLESIEVSAKNLVRFVYHGRKVDMSLKNVPLLSEVSIGCGYFAVLINDFCLHATSFSQVKKLSFYPLMLDFYRSALFPLQFPELSKLEQLEFTINAYDTQCLLWPISLIKAAPLLHRISMKLVFTKQNRDQKWKDHWGDREEKVRQAAKCKHQHLKVVEVIGFAQQLNCVELASCLINLSESLEKVIIDPRKYLMPPLKDVYPIESWPYEPNRMCARQLLEGLPPRVDRVIL